MFLVIIRKIETVSNFLNYLVTSIPVRPTTAAQSDNPGSFNTSTDQNGTQCQNQ
jgi:hypothetical protein